MSNPSETRDRPASHGDDILYLDSAAVVEALEHVDVVGAVARALRLHAQGATTLPCEAYLGWSNKRKETLRSINMPGALSGAVELAGTKVINANPTNTGNGLPRASGLLLLFCPETARITSVMDVAVISSRRTAAVSTLAAQLLTARPPVRLALLGAGTLAGAHAEMMLEAFPSIDVVGIYDLDRGRAEILGKQLTQGDDGNLLVAIGDSPRAVVDEADLVVPVTTTGTSYIEAQWLMEGSLLVNVSLSDARREVFLAADKLFVDDWGLVAADSRRTLGQLASEERVLAPGSPFCRGPGDPRVIDGELGDLLLGRVPGRESPADRIVVNPFGLAIEDLAVGEEVRRVARSLELGSWLSR